MKLELYSFNLKDIFEENIEDMSGFIIYKITNKITNQHYIGTTKLSILKRFIYVDHFKHSHRTKYVNNKDYLYNSMNKYGIENFQVDILHVCKDQETMYRLEKFFIYYFDSYENGFNKSFDGRSGGNSKEFSNYMKQKWKDPEYREKMIKILTEAFKNYINNPENRLKYSQDASKRNHLYYSNPYRYTEEKKKARSLQVGNRNKDPEFRKKVSKGLKNKYDTDLEYKLYVKSRNSKMNKDPEVILNQQIGKIKNILFKLEELNLEINEINYNQFVKCGICRYHVAIVKYPDLFDKGDK